MLMSGRRSIGIFRRLGFNLFKNKMTVEGEAAENGNNLQSKALQAESLAAELRNELVKLQTVVNALKTASNSGQSSNAAYQDLIKENESLKLEIERYKAQLSGRQSNDAVLKTPSPTITAVENPLQVPQMKPASKSLKEKFPVEKLAKEKAPSEKKAVVEKKSVEEAPVDIGRLDLRVGKIVEVKKHPDADSLYVEQVDVGEDKPRTIVSGLVKFVPLEAMQDRMVIILCNLKPAKMRGVTSEGMVMCASSADRVEVLAPPEGSYPGDLVQVDGFPRVPDSVLNPKKKIFETVAPELKTNEQLEATYRGVPWVVLGKGHVKTESLVGVNIK